MADEKTKKDDVLEINDDEDQEDTPKEIEENTGN